MILSSELLAEILCELKEQGKKIVFTNGCFDIIHSGHVGYLSDAKRLGDVLVLGLNSDASVKRLKGESRPVNGQSDRAIVLDALKAIDYVTVFDEDTPKELIELLKPDIIVKGGDYTPATVVGAEFVTANGGQVVIIPLTQGKSTTNIINKITK